MKKLKLKKFTKNTFKKWEREEKKRMKSFWYRIYIRSYRLFKKIVEFPSNMNIEVRSFFQRAKRGFSSRDVWGLHDYLSDTIIKSITHLKKNHNGGPINLTEGQWIDILNEIIETFETANKISRGTLYSITDKKWKKRWTKSLKELNEEYNSNDRCMTDSEIKKYKKGWRLFQKYFFNLWD